jgi:Dolichyl-phosphate-mannose-protein mannosyltransferase
MIVESMERSRPRHRRALPALARTPVGLVACGLAALLLATSNGYGYHRDELYFRMLGQHPAWGYVDQPPLTPLLGRLATAVFGDHLWALRLPATVCTVATAVLLALTARELGGGRVAQTLAALGAGSAELIFGHLLLTNPVDDVVSSAVLLFVIRALTRSTLRLRSTPSDQHEPVRQFAVATLLDMHEEESGVQHAIEHVGERQVTKPDETGGTSSHGARTAGAPPGLPIARMNNAGAVLSRLLGQRPGEARMQPDIDETTVRSQDAVDLCCKGREVVHVGVGERRHHQVEEAIREWEPGGVTLNQSGHKRPGLVPGDSELIRGGIDPHDRPSCARQSGQMCASPAAHIEAPAGTRPHKAQDQRRGGRAVEGDAFVVPVCEPVVARWAHQLPSWSTVESTARARCQLRTIARPKTLTNEASHHRGRTSPACELRRDLGPGPGLSVGGG